MKNKTIYTREASLKDHQDLYTEAVRFLMGEGMISLEQATKEYDITSRRIQEIGKENIGLRCSHRKISQAVGLQKADFLPGNIRNTIDQLTDAAEAKQRIYDRLLAGKDYRYILKLDQLLDLIDILIEAPNSGQLSADMLKHIDEQNADMYTVIGEESRYPYGEIYSVWRGKLLGFCGEQNAAEETASDSMTAYDTYDEITEEEREEIFQQVWDRTLLQNGLGEE